MTITPDFYLQRLKETDENRKKVLNAIFTGSTVAIAYTVLEDEMKQLSSRTNLPCLVVEEKVRETTRIHFYLLLKNDGIGIIIKEGNLEVNLVRFNPLEENVFKRSGDIKKVRLEKNEKESLNHYVTICEEIMTSMHRYRLLFVTENRSFNRTRFEKEMEKLG